MSEELTEIIYDFRYNNQTRSLCVLSDATKIRIDGMNLYALLKKDGIGKYSTDADIYVASELINPTKVKGWAFFDVDADIPSNTSIEYRLSDGTNQYYWSGSAWVQSVSNWSTQAEIEANIDTFPTVSKKLRIYANLKTTDNSKTPILKSIKVLIKAGVSMEEEVFIRSFIPYLKSARIVGDARFQLEADTDTIAWSGIPEFEDFNITAIKACFNLTDDLGEDVDILSSYDLDGKTITLTGVQNFDKIILVKFEYEPEVVMMTSPDYVEISKIPVLIIEGISEFETLHSANRSFVKNKTNLTARITPDSEARDFDIVLTLISGNITDQFRLIGAYNNFFIRNPLMTIDSIAGKCDFIVLSPFITSFASSHENQPSATATIRLKGANFWSKAPYDKYLVNKKYLTLIKQTN